MNLFKNLSRGRLFGHPIHSMTVHFPLALFPVGFIFDLLSLIQNNSSLSMTGFYCMGAGLIGAFLAIVFGTIDFLHLPNNNIIWRKAMIHASLNATTILGYVILFSLRYKFYPQATPLKTWELLTNGILILLLFVASHFGGELVYRHKVGTIEKERKEV